MTINTKKSLLVTKDKSEKKVWVLAFILSFLALLVNGADIALLSYSLTSLKQEFNITDTQAGSLGSWTLAGMAIGGFLGGWACDQFGRVRIIVLSIVWFSLLTSWLGFTHSFEQFKWLRFLSAIGLGALYLACNILMAEYVPTRHRTTVLATLMSGWTLGTVVATCFAGWILPEHGWRVLYSITIIPIVIAIIMHFFVPEPKAWLETKKIYEDKKQLAIPTPSLKNSFKNIFENPISRRMFILWFFASIFLQFGYYGMSTWLPTYIEIELGIPFQNMSIYMIGTFLIMICSKIISGIIADCIGRRIVFVFGTVGTAIFIPIIVFYNTPENIQWLLLVFGFLYGIPYGINATYMTESFATNIRGTAIGGSYNIGRLFAATAPLIVGYTAQDGSIGKGFLMMAIAYLLCGVIAALYIKDRIFDPQLPEKTTKK